MGMFELNIKTCMAGPTFKRVKCHSKYVFEVKAESGDFELLYCPGHNSQVEKRLWVYRDWRAQRGKD